MLESRTPNETSNHTVADPPPRGATALSRETDPEPPPPPPSTIAFTPRRWAFGESDEGVL